MVTLLPEALRQQLAEAALTYAEIGATADEVMPAGYLHLDRSQKLLDADFNAAAEQLLTWQMHERSGLKVAASHVTVEPDTLVLMHLGVGRASLRIPCQVVYVINELNRVGFAYGTLPGHPETGEERFTIERDSVGVISARIRAFSNPATALARASGPIGRAMQSFMTDRYLNALDAH